MSFLSPFFSFFFFFPPIFRVQISFLFSYFFLSLCAARHLVYASLVNSLAKFVGQPFQTVRLISYSASLVVSGVSVLDLAASVLIFPKNKLKSEYSTDETFSESSQNPLSRQKQRSDFCYAYAETKRLNLCALESRHNKSEARV